MSKKAFKEWNQGVEVNSNINPNRDRIKGNIDDKGNLDISVLSPTGNLESDKKLLIETMKGNGKNPSLYLDWSGMYVINPYFVYKFVGEKGVPIELIRGWIEEKGHKWIWTEWCEFWLTSFCKIPHKNLI